MQEKFKNALTDQDRKAIEKCFSQLTEIAKKQGEIIRLANGNNIELEISKLQRQLSSVSSSSKSEAKLSSVKHETADDLSNDDNSGFLKNNWKALAVVIILIFIIVPVFWGLWNAGRQIENCVMIQQILHNDIQNIEMRLDKLENPETPPEPPISIETPAVPKITWINIKESKTGKVEVGKSYTLEAQTGFPGSRKTVYCGGYFTASQSNLISNNNGESCELNVPSTYNENTITIYYVVNNERAINRVIQIDK